VRILPGLPFWVLPLISLPLGLAIFGLEWLVAGRNPGVTNALFYVAFGSICIFALKIRQLQLLKRLRTQFPPAAGTDPILAGGGYWQLTDDKPAQGVAILSKEKLTFFSGLLWDVPTFSILVSDIDSVQTDSGKILLHNSRLGLTLRFGAYDLAEWKTEFSRLTGQPVA